MIGATAAGRAFLFVLLVASACLHAEPPPAVKQALAAVCGPSLRLVVGDRFDPKPRPAFDDHEHFDQARYQAALGAYGRRGAAGAAPVPKSFEEKLALMETLASTESLAGSPLHALLHPTAAQKHLPLRKLLEGLDLSKGLSEADARAFVARLARLHYSPIGAKRLLKDRAAADEEISLRAFSEKVLGDGLISALESWGVKITPPRYQRVLGGIRRGMIGAMLGMDFSVPFLAGKPVPFLPGFRLLAFRLSRDQDFQRVFAGVPFQKIYPLMKRRYGKLTHGFDLYWNALAHEYLKVTYAMVAVAALHGVRSAVEYVDQVKQAAHQNAQVASEKIARPVFSTTAEQDLDLSRRVLTPVSGVETPQQKSLRESAERIAAEEKALEEEDRRLREEEARAGLETSP